jgi:hypothetical protein
MSGKTYRDGEHSVPCGRVQFGRGPHRTGNMSNYQFRLENGINGSIGIRNFAAYFPGLPKSNVIELSY